MLAQYSSSDSGVGALLFIYLLLLLGLAFIPAAIASNKGHSGVGFYFFGLLLFVPALIVALLIDPATPQRSAAVVQPPPSVPSSPQSNASATSSPTGSSFAAAPPSSQQPPVAMRECPFCREPMRRDASVCPHCRRESPVWTYRDGHWWAANEQGDESWLDNAGMWHAESEPIPELSGPTRLVLTSLGSLTPDEVAEIVTAHVIVNRGDIRRLAAGPLPMSLFRGASPAQALQVKDLLVAAGAQAEAQPVLPL
jgi:hypothetical protein